jgi:hypothetical protein
MYGPVSLNCAPRDVDGLATAAMMKVEVVGERRKVDEEEADENGAPTTHITAAVHPDSQRATEGTEGTVGKEGKDGPSTATNNKLYISLLINMLDMYV